MINVTKTFLPPQEAYNEQVARAFANTWITNRGELVLELEEKLRDYLAVQNIILTNNGTVPLQIALKLLANGGEVITTPFSYVATTAAIVWENCTPVFVDIHPEYFTIDETKIEAAITSKTTAILATHVYGNSCNVEAIEEIAKRYNLAVIYDAAHAFGVKYKNESIFSFGDVSTCSFHATKLFHTGEGGAMFCKDDELNHQLFYCHNFGHDGPLNYHGLGINGKMSELNAAMGLAVFPYLESIIGFRKQVVLKYLEGLKNLPLNFLKLRPETEWNYAYFPVVFENEEQLLKMQKALNEAGINPRRYFYPSLNTLPYVEATDLPIATSIAKRVMCLPLYYGLSDLDQERIIEIFLNF